MRRFGPNMRLGRPGRLGVVETIAIDSRRRLLLVRRDDVEHLLLIGGTADLVVESGIVAGRASAMPAPSHRGRAEPSFAQHLPSDDA
jgi:hypothetical protein